MAQVRFDQRRWLVGRGYFDIDTLNLDAPNTITLPNILHRTLLRISNSI
jgi:hypothetical protein